MRTDAYDYAQDLNQAGEMNELDTVFEAVATYFSVLSEPTRLKIMHAVCDTEKTVSQIVAATGGTQTNISRHLGLMYRQDVLAKRRDGNQIYYRVTDETMMELCRSVCNRIATTIDERKPLQRQLLSLMPPSKKLAA